VGSINKNKKMIVSFIINIIISILTLNIILMSIFRVRIIYGYEPSIIVDGVPIFSYFTTQSNIFVGIISFIFANREYLVLKKKKKDIPTNIYVLKFAATVAVSLTFFIVFSYLGFVVNGGHAALLKDNNFFFHLVIPVISIINFIVFEKTNKIKFKYIFFGVLPTFLYEIYYVSNLLITAIKDGVTPQNDWYFFVQSGIIRPIIAAPSMLLITFLLSLIIWNLNKSKKS
jgi:hypothetical protein